MGERCGGMEGAPDPSGWVQENGSAEPKIDPRRVRLIRCKSACSSVVNVNLRGGKEQRSFKPQVAGSIPVRRPSEVDGVGRHLPRVR